MRQRELTPEEQAAKRHAHERGMAAMGFAVPRMTPWTDAERVEELGEAIGFGQLMHVARDMWRRRLEESYTGAPGAEFAVGPCVAMTVPCGCGRGQEDDHCAWCCGTGWLTRRAKEAKDASQAG